MLFTCDKQAYTRHTLFECTFYSPRVERSVVMTGNELHGQIEQLLSELTTVQTQLTAVTAARQSAHQAIDANFAPTINPLTENREKLVDELKHIWEEHKGALVDDGGKSAMFRSGVLGTRTSPPTLVIADESAVMRYLRRHGLLKRFTKIGKRTIDKVALKKAPEVVEKITSASLETTEYFYINLPHGEAEIKRDLHPLRRRTK